MTGALTINIKFSSDAGRLLSAGASLRFPSQALSQQQLAPGDKIRFPDMANCPWFVVTDRYWDLGAKQVTLTIWLGVPED